MRIVLSLGGNAFVRGGSKLTMAGQFRYAEHALSRLRPLFELDAQIAITHGNGPQVGYMLIRAEEALGKAYELPLEVCVAESQGELGYVLELTLHNLLREWGQRRAIAALLTQVLVSADDPAFLAPTKPIGPYYSSEQADRLRQAGFSIQNYPGRGFRRVVPSPRPLRILELEVIRELLDRRCLVIAAGGGGIPVVQASEALHGVEAVIDKDLASALLATRLGADLLVILSDVPCAYRFFNQPEQKPIGRILADELAKLALGEPFEAGSMGPKVEAAIAFARGGGRAIITNAETLEQALAGEAGTVVVA
jgi:carbamate kinase